MPVTAAGIEAERLEDEAVARILPAVHDAVLLNAPVRPSQLPELLHDHPDCTARVVREAMWQLLNDDIIRLDTNLSLIPPGSINGL
ncbi:hypothetical protein [Curtobacterium sp. MCBD17_040]|uniref:hypothetical protein n=1 Tax=Curtobacterium sp. MCBD17_040 TaxID=2175674 RepID=UPI000DA8E0D4|nr:hypothetical protein [Curtobacterium sp. MCBD17_040]WIB65840.1 hypothetical protein DEI94_17145 [Curtobacterium sp. MCBD17_040]